MCKSELQVLLKANWAYGVIAIAVGAGIALVQGHGSIAFAFWTLIYSTVILFLIKANRWELHLPIKILPVPDCKFNH